MNKNTLIIADGTTTLNDLKQYITDVVIPDSVTEITDYAFSNCSNLKSITIPNGVTSIGSKAFMNCVSLKRISIPASVTEIDWEPFFDCVSLKEINSSSLTSSTPPNVYWANTYFFAGGLAIKCKL